MRESDRVQAVGWLSIGCVLCGAALPLLFALFVDASGGRPVYPWPRGGWPLPDVPATVAIFLSLQFFGVSAGFLSRRTRLGRLGLYGSISALMFCAVWLASAAAAVIAH